jgi:hypothetical protein
MARTRIVESHNDAVNPREVRKVSSTSSYCIFVDSVQASFSVLVSFSAFKCEFLALVRIDSYEQTPRKIMIEASFSGREHRFWDKYHRRAFSAIFELLESKIEFQQHHLSASVFPPHAGLTRPPSLLSSSLRSASSWIRLCFIL